MKMKTDDRIGYAHADKLLLPNNLLLRELEEMLADERTVMLKATGNSMLPFIVGGRDSVLIRRPSGIKSLQTGGLSWRTCRTIGMCCTASSASVERKSF